MEFSTKQIAIDLQAKFKLAQLSTPVS